MPPTRPPPPVASTARLHYLDAMRSVLMLLGVVLHSARPYDTHAWRVKDVQQMPALDAVVATLHLFRMPAFFVIAGFFAMYLVSRRPTAVFFRERMQRALVPLLTMLLSVNVVQVWFAAKHSRAGTADFFERVLLPALWSGQLVSHLWFLACLAVYFALTAALAPSLRQLAAASTTTAPLGRVGICGFWLLLAVAVVAPLGLAIISKLTAPALSTFLLGLIKGSTVLRYLPFFAVGVVLCAFPPLLERFARVSAWVIGLGACAGVGIVAAAGRSGALWQALQIVSVSLLTWMAVRVVFALFRRYADSPSTKFRYLSDASYSIYLFHHIVVVVVATWLLQVDVNAWIKFAAVLVTASLVSFAVYHFAIRPYVVPGFLFGGVIRLPRQRDAAAMAPLPKREVETGYVEGR